MLPYKNNKDIFILGGTDEIQQLWDDSNINISTIASSKHVGPIKGKVDEWIVKLELFGETIVSFFSLILFAFAIYGWETSFFSEEN